MLGLFIDAASQRSLMSAACCKAFFQPARSLCSEPSSYILTMQAMQAPPPSQQSYCGIRQARAQESGQIAWKPNQSARAPFGVNGRHKRSNMAGSEKFYRWVCRVPVGSRKPMWKGLKPAVPVPFSRPVSRSRSLRQFVWKRT